MRYLRLEEAIFISRTNRFIAKVLLNGKEETVHVINTGRCKELLVPGATVYVNGNNNPQRKTKYDLIAVRKGELLINMDAHAPNRLFHEFANEGYFISSPDVVRAEVQWGRSRLDFYVEKGERRCYIELKGVTLERDGVAMFPDAPTERGVRHLYELISAAKQGYEAYMIFIVQFYGAKYFTPNEETHPKFAEVLRKAQAAGVKVQAYQVSITPSSIRMLDQIPVRL